MLKERWIGHPSIPPRTFGPSQYLVMPPVQMIKPRLTSKLLPTKSSTSKLVQLETRSDAEDHWHVKLMAGGDARRSTGADATPITSCNGFRQSLQIWMQKHRREHLQPLGKLLPWYSLMWEMMKIALLYPKQLQFRVMWDELNTVQKWLRLVFLLKAEIKGTLPRSSKKDLTSSGWPQASQTLGYPHQSTVEANLEADKGINKEMMQRGKM